MTERPIIFSGPMVRAILDGKKTQTRRLVSSERWARWLTFLGGMGDSRDDPTQWGFQSDDGDDWALKGSRADGTTSLRSRYGDPGDRLWVRETWAPVPWLAGAERRGPDDQGVRYRATWTKTHSATWRPSIHMPRWASRLTLEVTSIRAERLKDITEEEARAEGATQADNGYWGFPGRGNRVSLDECNRLEARDAFHDAWDCINGKRAPWKSDPWVWVVSFTKVSGSP